MALAHGVREQLLDHRRTEPDDLRHGSSRPLRQRLAQARLTRRVVQHRGQVQQPNLAVVTRQRIGVASQPGGHHPRGPLSLVLARDALLLGLVPPPNPHTAVGVLRHGLPSVGVRLGPLDQQPQRSTPGRRAANQTPKRGTGDRPDRRRASLRKVRPKQIDRGLPGPDVGQNLYRLRNQLRVGGLQHTQQRANGVRAHLHQHRAYPGMLGRPVRGRQHGQQWPHRLRAGLSQTPCCLESSLRRRVLKLTDQLRDPRPIFQRLAHRRQDGLGQLPCLGLHLVAASQAQEGGRAEPLGQRDQLRLVWLRVDHLLQKRPAQVGPVQVRQDLGRPHPFGWRGRVASQHRRHDRVAGRRRLLLGRSGRLDGRLTRLLRPDRHHDKNRRDNNSHDAQDQSADIHGVSRQYLYPSSRMARLGRRLSQRRPLDVHVDVFQLGGELKLPLLDFPADLPKLLLSPLALLVGDQAHLGQHPGMGQRGVDVVRIQPTVEAHTFGELLHPPVGRLVEHTAPRLLGHAQTFSTLPTNDTHPKLLL